MQKLHHPGSRSLEGYRAEAAVRPSQREKDGDILGVFYEVGGDGDAGGDGMKYSAIYKCLLCGQPIRYGKPHEVPYDKLPELLGCVIRNQMFAGNPALHEAPMHIPHKCRGGSTGLAYFAGFMKEAQP